MNVARQRGFSLVELILAITITSIVLVGVAGIFLASQARNLEAQHQAAAAGAAAAEIEELRGQDFSSLTDGTTSFTPAGVPRLVSATIIIATVNDDLKHATVAVVWREGPRDKTVSLDTYINRYGVNRQ